MRIVFTEREMAYLERRPFAWRPSADAPSDVRAALEAKLAAISEQKRFVRKPPRRRDG